MMGLRLRLWVVAALALTAAAPQRANARGPRDSQQFYITQDSTGFSATFRPGLPPIDKTNPFFRALGTNGRACYSCHRPALAWNMTPARAQEVFDESGGQAPLFAPIDGATCPTDDTSSLSADEQADALLLNKALIRIFLPIPPASQFSVVSVDDPYGCTVLDKPTSGVLSMYRRPLPATNLKFEKTIMWDGREPNLTSQAADAIAVHEQPKSVPGSFKLSEIVSFDTSTFSAQLFDGLAGELDDGANGGPVALSRQSVSASAPASGGIFGSGSSAPTFNIYSTWAQPAPGTDPTGQRASIARGEQLFNANPITITGVAGLNDVTGRKTIAGNCGTCHNAPNVGNDASGRLLNIGVAAGTRRTPDLPLFTLECNSGPLKGQNFAVDDPGRALISGKCSDIGSFKVPALRALSARAPYFHDGSAATLRDVVEFYDDRFGLNLTDQQKSDLVNFLSAL
jgi:hypothetical protein